MDFVTLLNYLSYNWSFFIVSIAVLYLPLFSLEMVPFFFFFCISSLMLQMKLFQEPIIFFFFGKDSPWFWDNFIELFSQIVYSGWWFPKWGMRHEILHKADNQSHWLLFNTKVCQEWDYYYGNSFCIQGALWVLLFIYNYKPG